MQPEVKPELSVLIVNYNTWRECAAAVHSLRAHAPRHADGRAVTLECLVVDNCSPRRPAEEIEALRAALADVARDAGDPAAGRLIEHDDNAGYSRGVNLACEHSRGRWILVSNPDVLFTPDCVSALLARLASDPRAACVVPKGFWDADLAGQLPPNTLPTLADLLWTTAGEFSRGIRRWYGRRLARSWVAAWSAAQPLELPMISGCMFLCERAVFESLGRMDERFPLYYEDADLSRRMRAAGRALVQVPEARLVHFVNRSGQTDPGPTQARHDLSRARYFAKWYGPLGRALQRGCDRLQRAPLLAGLRRAAPDGAFVDLGASDQAPVLELARTSERFLLLISNDPRFTLGGGVLAAGSHWTPSPGMFANFSAATYWFRAFDLTGGAFDELGTWRFTCRRHLAGR